VAPNKKLLGKNGQRISQHTLDRAVRIKK